jgi:DNA-binding transcriptional LysR family regulator
MDLAVPARHKLAGQDVIEFDQLLDEPWVSWPIRTVCHNWLLHTFQGKGAVPNIVHTAAEYETQLALVAAGLGVAAVPRLGRGSIPGDVWIAALSPAPSRRVYAVWRPESARRPTVCAAIDILRAGVAL